LADLTGEAPGDDACQVLAAIVESSDLAILSKTLEGIITSWNPAAERLYGYTAQEAIGRPIALIVPPDRSDELAGIMAQLARGERVRQLETVRVHKDGHRIAVSLIVSPIKDAAGRIVGGASIARDLTEQKQAEAALQASEQRVAEILESIGDAFYTLDRDWRLTYLNARAEQLWGVQRQAVLGRSLWEVFPQAAGTHTHQEHRRAAREQRPLEYETRSPILGGWIEVNLYPNPTGLTVYFRDITARKQAEAAAREAVRVRDEVLGAVSHDLRNPLAAIKGQAQLLERWAGRYELPERERLVAGLQRIDAAASRMSSWIEELLDVTRLSLGQKLELRLTATDLAPLVRHAVDDYQDTTDRHQLRVEATERPLVGCWDAARLRRVLDNLLSNAIKYSPAGGDIIVTLERQEDQDGSWALVRVRDPGVGIPAADQPHVFEHFHRAGNVAGRIAGTGLGLAGSRRIVHQHGGALAVESEEGRGSTFTVRLPLTAGGAAQGNAQCDQAPRSAAG